MNSKKSGWRRIAILVSIIWFIGFAGYVWHGEVERITEFHSEHLRICLVILDSSPKSTNDWTKYEKCQSEGGVLLSREMDTQFSAIPLLLAVDFGTVAFGWLFMWGVIIIGRWVRRGFA